MGKNLFSIVVVVTAVLVFLALMGVSLIAFDGALNGRASSIVPGAQGAGPLDTGSIEAIVAGLFGTIQFAVAILSGLIIVFAAILSFVIGRSARESKASTEAEIQRIVELYRDNLDMQEKNLEVSARRAVDEHLDEQDVRDLLDRYRAYVTEFADKKAEMERVVDNFEKFQEATGLSVVDYSAAYQTLRAKDDAANKSTPGEQTERPPLTAEERTDWQRALLSLEKGGLLRQVTATTLFNGSQTAATYRMTELAHRLAVVSYWVDSNQLHKLRVLRSEHERGDRLVVRPSADGFVIESENPSNDPAVAARIREEAISEAFAALADIRLMNYHLLMSEVWNISVASEDLSRFIRALERVLAEKPDQPSYAYILCARAHSILSATGWRPKAQALIEEGIRRLYTESRGATWFGNSINDAVKTVSQGGLDVDLAPVIAFAQGGPAGAPPHGPNGARDPAAQPA